MRPQSVACQGCTHPPHPLAIGIAPEVTTVRRADGASPTSPGVEALARHAPEEGEHAGPVSYMFKGAGDYEAARDPATVVQLMDQHNVRIAQISTHRNWLV